MNFTVKQEFWLGMTSLLLVSGVIIWHTFQFYSQQAQLAELGKTSSSLSVPSGVTLNTDSLAKHSSDQDCWIIIENKVYDVTKFLSRHPGGAGYIVPYCGADATGPFLNRGGRGPHSALAFQILGLIYLGDMNSQVTHQPDTQAVDQLNIQSEDDD